MKAALLFASLWLSYAAEAQVQRVWLSHTSTKDLVISCETVTASPVRVKAWQEGGSLVTAQDDGSDVLHHLTLPFADTGAPLQYEVSTDAGSPVRGQLRPSPTDVLRVAVVADWGYAKKPDLTALIRDQPHLLLTAGDNVANHHSLCGAGVKDCTRAYAALIDSQPDLFRSTPFLPVLGNHDREIRPRGATPPLDPVYDVDATAYRRFFALPEPEWRWELRFPRFGVHFLALDLHHLSDFGTTWQTGQPFGPDSEQQRWFDAATAKSSARFMVALQNERNATTRSKPGWGPLLARCSAVVTGFGYFAERAEPKGGVPFFNTCLAAPGTVYADPASKFVASARTYMLLTFPAGDGPMIVELKSLEGAVLDRTEWPARSNR